MKNPTTAINLLLEHSRKYFIALESKIKQLKLYNHSPMYFRANTFTVLISLETFEHNLT